LISTINPNSFYGKRKLKIKKIIKIIKEKLPKKEKKELEELLKQLTP
jgi:hypothetical protein